MNDRMEVAVSQSLREIIEDGDSLHPVELEHRLFLIFGFNHQIAIDR